MAIDQTGRWLYEPTTIAPILHKSTLRIDPQNLMARESFLELRGMIMTCCKKDIPIMDNDNPL
jgi:hypothetical protein